METILRELHRRFIMGVDLGKTQDPSCYSIVEMQRFYDVGPTFELGGRPPITFHSYRYFLRLLKKFPLQTPYSTVVEDIARDFESPALHSSLTLLDHQGTPTLCLYTRPLPPPALAVDATGVGMGIVDYFRAMSLKPAPIMITNAHTVNPIGEGLGVPKQELVTTLQLMFNTRRIKVSRSSQLHEEFIKELINFRLSFTPSGHGVYAAARGHDDLVLATSLAIWYAEYLRKAEEFFTVKKQRLPRFNIYDR